MSEIKRNAIVIGVTGGIACGKSEVGRILEAMGFAVCDTDRIAHDLMRKGTIVYDQIVTHFGEKIVSNTGEIIRPTLGKIVFDDPAQRTVLNGLVHPAVRCFLKEWMQQQKTRGQHAAALVPLLFESGMQNLEWDAVVCVSSDEADVFHRLEKRGLKKDEAEKRFHSQLPLAEKEKLADVVIPNVGTLSELELVTRKTVQAIAGQKGKL